MDPNETLRIIRATIKQMEAEDGPPPAVHTFVQHGRDLAEQFENLDKWLSRGGFLPTDWKGASADPL